MPEVIGKSIEILKLAKNIIEKSGELASSAASIKIDCDQLGSTFKDPAYDKVYESVELVISGYAKHKDDLARAAEALQKYAEVIYDQQ